MSGPLESIRVIDLTTVLAGPTATQVLADYGAEVVKVEALGGDIMRAAGPSRSPGMGHLFLNLNRNKRSITLDLKISQGRDALLRLAAAADVLAYNVRPASMERLGLGYESLRKVNPRIIYAGALGFSQRGPYAARPAYDDLIQGMSGLPWLSEKAGSGVPRYAPTVLADRTVGLHLAIAILAALQHRARTGEGQRVDVPMYEVMVSGILSEHLAGLTFVPPIGQGGYSRSLAAERRPFPTQDGHVCVLVYNDNHWRNFSRVIGQPDLMEHDPRFASQAARLANIDVVYGLIRDVLATKDTADWLRILAEADIPVGPMNSVEDILRDPHLNAIGFFQEVEHPTEGRIVNTSVPTEWSASPPALMRLAPRPGEHTREVLTEAGFTSAEIERLEQAGATGPSPSIRNQRDP